MTNTLKTDDIELMLTERILSTRAAYRGEMQSQELQIITLGNTLKWITEKNQSYWGGRVTLGMQGTWFTVSYYRSTGILFYQMCIECDKSDVNVVRKALNHAVG